VYINVGENNGSEKLWTQTTATSGKPIKAVHASYVYDYTFLYKIVRLEYNSVFVGPAGGGGGGVRDSERNICH